jgi:hypothetical protein
LFDVRYSFLVVALSPDIYPPSSWREGRFSRLRHGDARVIPTNAEESIKKPRRNASLPHGLAPTPVVGGISFTRHPLGGPVVGAFISFTQQLAIVIQPLILPFR